MTDSEVEISSDAYTEYFKDRSEAPSNAYTKFFNLRSQGISPAQMRAMEVALDRLVAQLVDLKKTKTKTTASHVKTGCDVIELDSE